MHRGNLLVLLTLLAAPMSAQYCWEQNSLGTSNASNGVFPLDFDGDGDVDIASIGDGFAGGIIWYDNLLGDGTSWQRNDLGSGIVGYPSNVDGDGDIDIVYLDNGGIMWLEQSPGGWVPHLVTTTNTIEIMMPADPDGDGDEDILVRFFLSKAFGWYENDGSSSWAYHTIYLPASNNEAQNLELADMDGDGDQDVIAGELSAGIRWHENLAGDGLTWTPHVIDAALNGGSLKLGDLDGDGDTDVVTTDSSTPSGTYWHENLDGAGGAWTTHKVYTRSWNEIELGDLDQDGDLDVIVSNISVGTDWLENTGSGSLPWPRTGITANFAWARGNGIKVADIDGDQDPDLVLSGFQSSGLSGTGTASLAWIRNQAVQGQENVRLGTPPNPLALSAAASGSPAIGKTWEPVVSSFQLGGAFTILVVDLGPPINHPSPFGTQLCSLPSPGQIFFSTPDVPFAITVPLDCGFMGLSACAQGGSFAPGVGLALTNALDLVIGTYR